MLMLLSNLDFVYVFRMAGFKRAPIVLNWAIVLISLIKVHWITLKDESTLEGKIILWSRMRGNGNFFQSVIPAHGLAPKNHFSIGIIPCPREEDLELNTKRL